MEVVLKVDDLIVYREDFYLGMSIKDLLSQVNPKFNLGLSIQFESQHDITNNITRRKICEFNPNTCHCGYFKRHDEIDKIIRDSNLDNLPAFEFIVHIVRIIRNKKYSEMPRRFLVNYGTWTTLPSREDDCCRDQLYCMVFDSVEKEIIFMPQDSNWGISENTYIFKKDV